MNGKEATPQSNGNGGWKNLASVCVVFGIVITATVTTFQTKIDAERRERETAIATLEEKIASNKNAIVAHAAAESHGGTIEKLSAHDQRLKRVEVQMHGMTTAYNERDQAVLSEMARLHAKLYAEPLGWVFTPIVFGTDNPGNGNGH